MSAPPETSHTSPLHGFRVADFGHHRAGPHCGALLARLGAEVIKVEPIGGEQLRSHGLHWAIENNTKKSITLDLRRPEGQSIALDLVDCCDVLVQNFRPGVMERLGLGTEALLKRNPRLIVANISAFGATTSQRLRPGFDGIMQALTGLMMLNGDPDTPPVKTHPPIVDRVAGLHAALGCLAALIERERTGQGQALDVSLLGSAYTIPDADLAAAVVNGRSPERTGNRAGGPPVNNSFQVEDGWIYIATGGRENMWQSICELIDRRDWLQSPSFATKADRMARAGEIESAVQQFLRHKTQEEAISLLNGKGIPVAPVRTPVAAVADRYPFENGFLTYVSGMEAPTPVTGDVWHFSRSEVAIGDLPRVGEHTDDVLAHTLNYSVEKIIRLRKDGVVA